MSRFSEAFRSFRDYMNSPVENSITRFAWAMVAVIALALVALNWYTISTLSARDWCQQIMTTEKYLGPESRLSSAENIQLVIDWCGKTGLMQLQGIAWVAKVLAVALGLIPVAVFVVKFSGASFRGNVGGNSFSMGREDRDEAAEQVAQAAVDEAERITRPGDEE